MSRLSLCVRRMAVDALHSELKCIFACEHASTSHRLFTHFHLKTTENCGARQCENLYRKKIIYTFIFINRRELKTWTESIQCHRTRKCWVQFRKRYRCVKRCNQYAVLLLPNGWVRTLHTMRTINHQSTDPQRNWICSKRLIVHWTQRWVKMIRQSYSARMSDSEESFVAQWICRWILFEGRKLHINSPKYIFFFIRKNTGRIECSTHRCVNKALLVLA